MFYDTHLSTHWGHSSLSKNYTRNDYCIQWKQKHMRISPWYFSNTKCFFHHLEVNMPIFIKRGIISKSSNQFCEIGQRLCLKYWRTSNYENAERLQRTQNKKILNLVERINFQLVILPSGSLPSKVRGIIRQGI